MPSAQEATDSTLLEDVRGRLAHRLFAGHTSADADRDGLDRAGQALSDAAGDEPHHQVGDVTDQCGGAEPTLLNPEPFDQLVDSKLQPTAAAAVNRVPSVADR